MIKAPPTPKKKKVAVFIDAANFEISLKQSKLWADYKKLLKFVNERGDTTFLGYYSPLFKTKGQGRFFTLIKNKGFKIITKNKANFDVEITFDAAVRIGKFNKFILFSGDSDFVYLVLQLQRRGIYTTIISPGWRTAKELKKQADEFIELKDCDFVVKKAP